MRTLYRPGSSILHRLPAGAKLAALAVLTLVLALYPHDATSVAIALIAVAALYAVARMPAYVFLSQVWQLRWIVLVLGGMLVVFTSWQQAIVNSGRVVALVLLAGLLTATTPMGALLDVLTWMLRPLRRFGVDADAVAMSVSLTITMIPVVAGFAARVREAIQSDWMIRRHAPRCGVRH